MSFVSWSVKAAPGLSESSVRKDGETQREGREEEKEEEGRDRDRMERSCVEEFEVLCEGKGFGVVMGM